MNKKIITKVTKYEINKAAELIASRGEIPTIKTIKAELKNRGSEATVCNYLKEWKKAKLLSQQVTTYSINKEELLLIENYRNLEQTLKKQILKNENYAQELINLEKNNIMLKREIHKLEDTIQDLTAKLSKETAVNHNFNNIIKEIQQQLAINTNNTIKQQELLIEELRQEIKTLTAKSIETIQELSSQKHEALTKERIVSINLQTKIDNLIKELAENKQQLDLANLKAQLQTQDLQRQINWQQQLLKKHFVDERSLLSTCNQESSELQDSYGK